MRIVIRIRRPARVAAICLSGLPDAGAARAVYFYACVHTLEGNRMDKGRDGAWN